MSKKIGLYIHVPFCAVKCSYCSFYSVAYQKALEQEYVSALIKHLRRYEGSGYSADTLYFGGGTPSLIQSTSLDTIISECSRIFSLSKSGTACEVTLEANPNTVSLQKLCELKSAGINRISFGMQSSSQAELTALGRRHSITDVHNAVNDSIRAGIDNISVDLMLGTPYQAMSSLNESLSIAVSLPVKHLSAYMLKVEESTPLYSDDELLMTCSDDDTLSDMYLHTVGFLARHGLFQYEISSFAAKGYESRHNLKYWHGDEYIGFGAAAHSHLNGKRFFHPNDISAYIKTSGENTVFTDEQSDDVEEYIMLRLRLTEGLSLSELELKFHVDSAKLRSYACKYVSIGYAVLEDDRLTLTPEGFLVSNTIIFDIIQNLCILEQLSQ